ncbi:MAG: prephenate dehydrogenase/arogenate dehydrogenase family protein, partial [Deltaproteobacteria bacterium]|nr:prephenate dehydrogenase/arogenate dehydrogenase family protein [Candidatus Desulfacyla euxinica]
MKILILGAGHMGAWLVEELCLDHEVAVYDLDRRKLKYFFNVTRFLEPPETEEFAPELVINAVSIANIQDAFEDFLPYLPEECILSDLASVKAGINELYKTLG